MKSNNVDLDQVLLVCYIQLQSFIPSQQEDSVKIHLFMQLDIRIISF